MAQTLVPYSGGLIAQYERARARRTVMTIHAHGFVQQEKLRQVKHLSQKAMEVQVMLRRWSEALANGDPIVSDELRYFTEVARLGMGEIMLSTIADFCGGGW